MGVLSNLVVAITGTFPADTANIRKWVEANGGKWSTRVNERVTHLVTGKDAWKNVTDPVMQAAELKIFIVSYDWLEDSLQGKRKLAEKKYTWEVISKDRKRKRELKKLGAVADGKKFVEGCKKITELTGSGTSKKLPPARKHKPSKSFFFAGVINTPFVSAKDDLMRRRAKREAAEAAERAAKATKKASSSGTAQAPTEIQENISDPATDNAMSTPQPYTSSTNSALGKNASPISSKSAAEPQAKKLSLKDLYHYYLDSTGFEYKIMLARSNFALNNITRYQLSILESHITPHTYCTLVQYTPPSGTAPEAINGISGSSIGHMRNSLLNFLKQADDEARKEQTKCSDTTTNNNGIGTSDEHPETTSHRSLITTSQDINFQHTEPTRLRSLITPNIPSSATSYKTLICPMNSPFASAWRAFRHIFRDLTLLSWEERFDDNKTVQKARAKALAIEPYLYSKPALGMPVGLRVQEAGLYQGRANETMILCDAEDGYVRNEYGLPGVDEPLGLQGVIGAEIMRDEEKERKRVEAAMLKAEGRDGKMQVAKPKRQNFNKPLFNGATGRTRTEAFESGAGVHAELVRENSRFVKSGRHWGYDE